MKKLILLTFLIAGCISQPNSPKESNPSHNLAGYWEFNGDMRTPVYFSQTEIYINGNQAVDMGSPDSVYFHAEIKGDSLFGELQKYRGMNQFDSMSALIIGDSVLKGKWTSGVYAERGILAPFYAMKRK